MAVSHPGDLHIDAICRHNEQMGIKSVKVGMYHSHPGLKVFMSVIDVGQNRSGQIYGDEHVSIVIDPIESVATGRLEIGAFRRCARKAACIQILPAFSRRDLPVTSLRTWSKQKKNL